MGRCALLRCIASGQELTPSVAHPGLAQGAAAQGEGVKVLDVRLRQEKVPEAFHHRARRSGHLGERRGERARLFLPRLCLLQTSPENVRRHSRSQALSDAQPELLDGESGPRQRRSVDGHHAQGGRGGEEGGDGERLGQQRRMNEVTAQMEPMKR